MPPATVLVVGSGPTGLITAAQLLSRGVPCRIIDRLAGPQETSRAFTVHARTLELLRTMGLDARFLERGIRTRSMDYHFPNKPDVPRLDFTEIDSPYPFCLTLEQVQTEALLRQHLESLGGVIEWQTRLTEVRAEADGVEVTLAHEGGADEVARFDWVVGCDGFRSTVRQALDLPLEGEDYEGMMKMIDVKVTGFPGSDDAIHYYVAPDHMLLVNALDTGNHRVLISDRTGEVPLERAREVFQGVLDRHFGGAVRIDEPEWATNFYIGRRQVNRYREGRLLLAGDAAHVNSPAGGQGMNVSMQDAFNLGWKLALVAKGKAQEALLDSYEAERVPVAAQMLEGTHYIHSIIMAHGKGMTERLERMSAPGWNQQAVNQIAGVSYTYRAADAEGALAAGDRAPDMNLADGTRLYDQLDRDGFTVCLSGPADAQAAERVRALQGRYPVPIKLLAVEGLLGLEVGAVVLIRPDGHIAHIAPSADWGALTALLDGLLVPVGG